MSPVDHYTPMMQAAQRAANHQVRAVLAAELADQPDIPIVARLTALETALREAADAESAVAEFVKHANEHAEQSRTILRAFAEGAGERLAASAPKASA